MMRVLVALFIALLLAGVPIAAALGLGGMIAIAWMNPGSPFWGLLAAPQNAHGDRQVPAAGAADVRAGRRHLRSIGCRRETRGFRASLRRQRAGTPAGHRDPRRDDAGRHLGLGAGDRRGGRRGHARGDGSRRLSARLLGEHRRRCGGHRHPHPALDRPDRLQRQHARCLGAGAVRGRHHPRNAGRTGPHRSGRAHLEAARLRREQRRACPAAVLGLAARSLLGSGREGADPRGPAPRLVHAD